MSEAAVVVVVVAIFAWMFWGGRAVLLALNDMIDEDPWGAP